MVISALMLVMPAPPEQEEHMEIEDLSEQLGTADGETEMSEVPQRPIPVTPLPLEDKSAASTPDVKPSKAYPRVPPFTESSLPGDLTVEAAQDKSKTDV